ncbi:Structural maintenance of chromosomes protein 5 [Malassezia brasiliensis]|uniref:Structural maintenance of chromosomes protein 5 n=1 Tax=Malassezia brasiliensis TaxID=1821822 RepID=A0AAF0ISH5_9BASI|nr:Structural maintenance of chromosomes protein 5 [Malassezia brasiliensis]
MTEARDRGRAKRRRADADVDAANGEEDGSPGPREHSEERANAEEGSATGAEVDANGSAAGDVEAPPPALTPPSVRTRNADGFVPGAIVRVACENFVTYDAVEFFPGPYLNMIIGPNGTGKSTVVCAIALGLGWKPSVLGRAKDVASYVKLGHEQGWVEVELQGFPGAPNVTVRRILFRESNSSDWLLNGQNASSREVHAAVSPFHIEVGNLCAFLPQDRVADFACMNAARLLQETQHAAGHAQLSEWHAELITQGHALTKIRARLERDVEEHDHLEARNQVLERDVRRYEERVELEKRVALLHARIPYAQYREAKQRYDAARAQRSVAKEAVRSAERALVPLQEEREKVEQRIEKLDVRLAERRRDADAAQGAVKRIAQEREQTELEMATLHEQEKQLETAEVRRQQLLTELRERIAELAHRAEQAPPASAEVDAELRSVKAEMRSVGEEMRDGEAQLAELAGEARQQAVRRQHAEQQLAQLNNLRHQRLQILAHADRDTFNAVQWLASHRAIFQHEVYDPVLVLLDVKQPAAARAIESCLNWNVQRTFVCQSRADYDLLTHELIDKRGWRLNVVELEGGRPLDAYTPPLPPDELHALGFDDYAIDLVDAPRDVLRFLCQTAHFHLIPIASRRRADPEQVERSGLFQRYIIGSTLFTTLVSKYGKRLPVTQSRDLKPLRNFAHAAQSEARATAEHELAALAEAAAQLETRRAALQHAADAHAARYAELTRERDALAARQHEAHRLATEHRKTLALLDAERQKLAREETRAPIAVQRRQLGEQRRALAIELAKLAERLLRTLETLLHAREECDTLVLSSLAYVTQRTRCAEALREKQATLRDVHHTLEQTLATFTEAKEETLACKRRYEQQMDECDDAMRELFREQYVDDTDSVDQLEMQLQSAQAALEIPWGVGANVVEAFRARKAQVAALQEAIRAARLEQAQVETAIQRVENRWLPALEALVSNINERFSAAFQRLGCAGEVRLTRDDDYEKWGIDILVKFRDTEQLKPLTGQRQSGGERSLSTILYLLSLTELSRSPFSLVDEINQGMDPRAERAVHDQMVAITCRPEAGQYFLITPKLLSGLRYHALMKVLLINNGDWLPEQLKLSDVAARKRARQGQDCARPALVAS